MLLLAGSVLVLTMRADRVELILPWPPSVNHYWLRNRDGGMRISPEGLAFRVAVRNSVVWHHSPKLVGRLSLRILAAPPDHRRRDLDNILKALGDALQAARVFKDDSQIDYIEIERGLVGKPGSLMVWVKEIGTPVHEFRGSEAAYEPDLK